MQNNCGIKLAARQISSVEATKAVFARIAKIEPIVGAYISTFEEQAIARAAEIDKRIAAGEKLGQLAGVPVAVKDNDVHDVWNDDLRVEDISEFSRTI